MDNIYNPQLASIQTQMQQLQNILNQKPPMVAQAPSVQIAAQSIPQVEGIEGAREYLKKLPANSTAAVFDKADSVFYGLAVDANGIPAPIKIGRFTLEDAPDPGSNVITRQDFDAFRDEIRSALAALAPRKEETK